MAVVVLLLHGLLAAALLHVSVQPRPSPAEVPVAVQLLPALHNPQVPAPAPLPAPQRLSSPPLPWVPAPEVPNVAATPEPAVAAQTLAPAEPTPQPQPAQAQAPATMPTPAPARPAAAVSPPAPPREVPPGAVAYRVAPPVAVPLASRRLRESGVVWLRVLVDRQGLPQRVSLHKSSGYPRLDEQALAAMQQARFVPQTENGEAIEWMVIAPIAYEVD